MKIAMLSPIAWRTPPRHYGPWEQVVSLLTEGLVKRGIDVTLFATADSQTAAQHHAVCPRGYEEDPAFSPKVWECLHIAELFERADAFDLIHNHFDFLPLSYSGLIETPVVTTIHGFSSQRILPVYKKYNRRAYYVSISNADRAPELDYVATVYHGIDLRQFTFRKDPGEYLLFFGRIHDDKGAKEAIEIARMADMRLIMAGIIHDQRYYDTYVAPYVDGDRVQFRGSAGPELRDELLRNAYALLHPVNFEEPFGLSVVESMACGTPVVAFSRGSMPELIRDGENGFLVSDNETAVAALKKIPGISRERCRQIAEEEFSVERMVEGYISVYRTVLAQDNSRDSFSGGLCRVLSRKPDHDVRRITLYPGSSIALHRHREKRGHYYIVCGTALVTREDQETILQAGESIDIPVDTAHRIVNTGQENLVFFAIQHGETPRDDDIEYLE